MPNLSLNPTPNAEVLSQLFEASFVCLIEEYGKESSGDHLALAEWFDVSQMIAMIKAGDARLVEARDGEELAGAVCVGKQSLINWQDGQKIEIFILAVHPNHRKKGLGKLLLVKAEEMARELGGRSIMVNTHHSMTAIQQFYLKQGYEEMGRLTDYYDNGDAVFFSKNL